MPYSAETPRRAHSNAPSCLVPPLPGPSDERELPPAGVVGTGARRLPGAGAPKGAHHHLSPFGAVDSLQGQQQEQRQPRPSLAPPSASCRQQRRQGSVPGSATEDFVLAQRLQVSRPQGPEVAALRSLRRSTTTLVASANTFDLTPPDPAPCAGGGGSQGCRRCCRRVSHTAPLV